jgi:hypothetical protein
LPHRVELQKPLLVQGIDFSESERSARVVHFDYQL